MPDDDPVNISLFENGIKVTQPTELKTGLQKSIEIQLPADSAHVTLTHSLTNIGLWDVTCAPWAITQFKTGGMAIFPQIKTDTGVLPNRSLTLWPYTDMTSPNVHYFSIQDRFPQSAWLAGILAEWSLVR